jgi:hypothetical protein
MNGLHISIVGAFISAIASLFIAFTEKNKRLLALIIFVGAFVSIWGGASQSKETEDLITGGKSFCYVTVSAGDGGEGWMTNPVVKCEGDLPAYDVSVLLYDPDSFNPEGMSQEEFLENNFQFDVGTIWPNGYKIFGGTRKVKFTDKSMKKLEASVTTRNSFFQEKLLFKKTNDVWTLAVRLYRTDLKNPTGLGELVLEWAQPNFPRDNQNKIAWE